MMQLTLNRALEAVAADALYAATSVEELQAAWGDHCDEFADETPDRARLLKLFEVTGREDPWVGAQRRRLAAILFG